MPEIKFYYASGACSLAPHILLREIGVEFEGIALRNNKTVVQFPESFRKINPKMRGPVLALDSENITEVPAIATAISSLAPDRHLMGRTPLDTARVYEWMSYLSNTLHGAGFGHLFRPQRWSDDPEAFESIRTKARECVREGFEMIEGRLDGVYAVGDELTAVEPYLFVFWRWGNEAGFEMKVKYPKYAKLVENLVEREAVRKTLEVEGIELPV